MIRLIFFGAFTMLLTATQSSVAGTCSCKDQIDNASAEVSGSCSKVWSNNHCTLKEDSSTSAALRASTDVTVAQAQLGERLNSTGALADDTVAAMLSRMFEFGYLNEVRGLCREKLDLPLDLFETYVAASLMSVGPDNQIRLLVSENLFKNSLQLGREFGVAKRVCSDTELASESADNLVLMFGRACFAGGNSEENFAISFTRSEGCPEGLEF